MTDTVSTDARAGAHMENMSLVHDGEDAWSRLQLREIHHRIRNSLNLICCTLQVQGLRSGNQDTRRALSMAADRINSLARVQGLLDGQGGRRRTGLDQYAANLLCDLEAMLIDPDDGRSVRLIHADAVQLQEDELALLGSIVTELVTNAVKYGAGDVAVSMHRSDSNVVLTVEDEGGGFPSGFDFASAGGLGLRLVRQLCLRAAGTVSIDHSATHGKVIASVGIWQSRQLELGLCETAS